MPPPASPDASKVRALEDVLQLQSTAVHSGIHEIRGLLLAGGYAKLLLHEGVGPLTAAQREYLNAIVENTRRIKHILTGISRVMDAAQLQLTRIQLSELLEEVLRESKPPTDAQCEHDDAAECRIFITGDRKKLRIALLDILQTNAWTGRVSIGVHEEKRNTVISIRGGFDWSALPVADEVQEFQSMLLCESTEVPADLFAKSRDTVHLHGGSLSARVGPENCEVAITLPILSIQIAGVTNV